MKRTLFALAACAACALASAGEVRVLTDRTDDGTMRPLFEAFEKETGIRVQAVFIDDGLLSRLASRPTEADLVITKDAEIAEQAKQKGLLSKLPAQTASSVPAAFRDKDGRYFVDAYRARVILASKDRVPAGAALSYEELADPKWKGKICVRSGLHDYNIALFDQFIVSWGPDKARQIIAGIGNNLARKPSGNDREQARAISQGQCDLALINTYYYPKMLANPEQKAWAEATRIIFPNQNAKGAFIMRSAVALTAATERREEAAKLADFMASPKTQALIVEKTQQYSVLPGFPVHSSLAQAGAAQGLRDGKFKMDFVPLDKMAEARSAAIRIVNETGFDQGPGPR